MSEGTVTLSAEEALVLRNILRSRTRRLLRQRDRTIRNFGEAANLRHLDDKLAKCAHLRRVLGDVGVDDETDEDEEPDV